MKQPNFFIVGGPKCGTTALSEYLRTHPQVFISQPKEPHFFALDFPRHRAVTQWADYLDLFSAADEFSCVGEASVFYLYSTVAAREIKKKCPNARILVMLRNPVELAVSMHGETLKGRAENVTDFAKAWRLAPARAAGREIPRHAGEPKTLLYDQLPLLGQQLQRLLHVFDKAQVKWIFFDDFVTETAAVYREVVSFLGVPDDGRKDFPQINAQKRARSQNLAQFTQRPPRKIVDTVVSVKKRLGIKRLGILDALRRLNFSRARHAALSPELLAEMRTHFAADVRLLEELTGRDLTHWLQP